MICQSPSSCPAAPGRCPGLSKPYWSVPEEKLVWGNLCSFWKRTQLSAGQRLVRLKSFSDSIAKWCLAGCRRGRIKPQFPACEMNHVCTVCPRARRFWDQTSPALHMSDSASPLVRNRRWKSPISPVSWHEEPRVLGVSLRYSQDGGGFLTVDMILNLVNNWSDLYAMLKSINQINHTHCKKLHV